MGQVNAWQGAPLGRPPGKHTSGGRKFPAVLEITNTWNGTNGGVINGGVSKNMRKHTKYVEFAQSWPDLREIYANLRNVFCQIYAHVREIYGPVCYSTVCPYLNTSGGIKFPAV